MGKRCQNGSNCGKFVTKLVTFHHNIYPQYPPFIQFYLNQSPPIYPSLIPRVASLHVPEHPDKLVATAKKTTTTHLEATPHLYTSWTPHPIRTIRYPVAVPVHEIVWINIPTTCAKMTNYLGRKSTIKKERSVF